MSFIFNHRFSLRSQHIYINFITDNCILDLSDAKEIEICGMSLSMNKTTASMIALQQIIVLG